jgi:adenine-specific DNA-methyltransferase
VPGTTCRHRIAVLTGRYVGLVVLANPETVNYGEVFTRRWVVEVLLDLTGYAADRDLSSVRLLEPACGSGAFLGPVVERLIASARARGQALSSLGEAIRAYDLQAEHVDASRALCRELLMSAGAPEPIARTLAESWVRHADFLVPGEADWPAELGAWVSDDPAALWNQTWPITCTADVVVGNPPYIRYDDLPENLAALYRRTWTTMRGRGDIYVGFIERSLRTLKPGGVVGFICADRWMRNQYGEALRNLVASEYAVEHVWTMHDVDAFEDQVSAYPAITVLGNHGQGPVVVADTTAEFGPSTAFALVKAVGDEAFTDFAASGVKAHKLPHWFEGGEFWPTGSPARLALIEYLNDRFRPLEDPAAGTKVSIGIATGADKVYVTKDPTVVERDRILPLAMRRDLMSGTFDWQGNYLVNPWDENGKLVSLAAYPRMAAYLSGHPVLRERFVAKREPGSWHRTIDKVQPGLTEKPKLLIQDMKAHIHPVLEPGGHYPHHNLYYVVSDTWDMEVLGGILLSRIAQAIIEAYCVRMRGDTLRFQAQYLRRIRVPKPDQISAATQEKLRVAFRSRDTDAATKAAAVAYGIDLKGFDLDK